MIAPHRNYTRVLQNPLMSPLKAFFFFFSFFLHFSKVDFSFQAMTYTFITTT